MEASVKAADFVAMQGQMMLQKASGADYKNDAFYRFMKQTADSQKTSDSTGAKKDTSTKETPKDDSLDKTEDTTKPETENTENATNDVKDTKDNMLQQMDLALLAAAVNTNMVTAQEVQPEKMAKEQPIAQAQVLTQAEGIVMEQTTEQPTEQNQTMPQNTAEKVVQVDTKQPQMTAEKTLSEQNVPKEVANVTNAEQNKQQPETVKTDAKAVNTEQQTAEAEITTTAKQSAQQKDGQTNTSSESELPEQTMEAPVKKTFSEDVVTVKVGENAQINDPEAAQKLADKMLTKLSQNQNEFEIQLTPKELGKITVKLVMENGQAHISMFAENAKTMNLLAEKARELGAIIQQHTGNETNVEVVDQKTMENQNQNKEEKGDGFARQQQEQQRQHQQRLREEQSRDFIQQMRLGLWSMAE